MWGNLVYSWYFNRNQIIIDSKNIFRLNNSNEPGSRKLL